MRKHFDIVDVVYAHFRPFDELWEDTDKRMWISLADKNLEEMTSIVKDAIFDQERPKNIICLFFQKYVGGCDNELMREYVNELVEATKAQKWNKLSIATSYFVPSHMQVWDKVGEFNKIAHDANEAMGMPRLNVHRSLMAMVLGDGSDKTLRVRFSMWIEPQLGVHLGTHPSFEGVAKIVDTVVKTFDHAFKFRKPLPSRFAETRVMVPPCLSITPGYNKNNFMRHLLADRGVIERDRGVKRQIMSDQLPPGWQNWHVYRTHGNLSRYNEREGMLVAHKLLLKRSDKLPIWNIEQEADTDNSEAVQGSTEDEMENLPPPTVDIDQLGEAYDPDEWVADKDLEIEFVNNQDGEIEVMTRRVVFLDTDDEMEQDKVDDQTKEEQKDYNEDENCVKKLELAERKLTIAMERIKAYKEELERKNLIISKEKAAVKFYRHQSESKKERIEFLEKENDRIVSQYKYLKNVYKARGAKDLK